jgi:hypothetical protein
MKEFDDFLKELLEDEEFKKEYEATRKEYEIKRRDLIRKKIEGKKFK